MNQRGVILISTLWIIMILSFLAIGIGFRISMEARLTKYNMDGMKAVYLANAGIAKCQDLLLKDTNTFDSLYYCGVTPGPEEDPKVELQGIFAGIGLGDGAFTVSYKNEDGAAVSGMADEERKININKAGQQVLVNIFGNAEIASAIMDWRDIDSIPEPSGAEDNFYGSLESPYKCKNGEFAVLEELLLVKGVTPEIFDSLKGYLTIYGDGKININTVSKRVLLAFGMTEAAADALVRYRSGLDGAPGTKDDLVFTDINIETLLPGLDPEKDVPSIANIKSFFTTKSNYFKLESRGVVTNSKIARTVEAILVKDVKCGAKLIHYHE